MIWAKMEVVRITEHQKTRASAGLQDANPTIRPYATPLHPIPTAHQAMAPNSDCFTAISI